MVTLKSSKTQMMHTHASRAKTGGSVSTHNLDDQEAEEMNTMFRRSGKRSETKHERFEHEELLFVSPQESPNRSAASQICPELEEDLGEGVSEGEAPETMTAAAGLSQSRRLSSKAAMAVEKQKVAATQKRKKRDIRLKFQAHSKKRNVKELDLPSNTIEDAPTGEKINDKIGSQNLVPALLPASILLVEPAGPVFRSNLTSKKSDSTSHRLLNLLAVPPKDLKEGTKTVRILESNRVLLPPRSALCGKTLRESWIFGRRSGGQGRNGIVPRRKMGNGFIRRGE